LAFNQSDVRLDSSESIRFLLEEGKVDLPGIVVIAGQEVASTANGCDGGRSPEVDVDEFPRFGCANVFSRWRRKTSTLPHDARLAFEIVNVMRGDCMETINSTSSVQSHHSSSTHVAQAVVPISKY
jgi:hypothetical protein